MTFAWPRPAAHAGTGSRPDDLRRANRAAVVRTLHLRGATSRAALGSALQLNRSTIKSVVDGLADQASPLFQGARRLMKLDQ